MLYLSSRGVVLFSRTITSTVYIAYAEGCTLADKPLTDEQKKKNTLMAAGTALGMVALAFFAKPSEAASGVQVLDRTYTVIKAGE